MFNPREPRGESPKMKAKLVRYMPLCNRLFVGDVITPLNCKFDRQELARFAEWVRKFQHLPIMTVRYPCRTVGYLLPAKEIERYQYDRQRQQDELIDRMEQITLEKAALTTNKLFKHYNELPPEFVLNLVKSFDKRAEVDDVKEVNGDPEAGTITEFL